MKRKFMTAAACLLAAFFTMSAFKSAPIEAVKAETPVTKAVTTVDKDGRNVVVIIIVTTGVQENIASNEVL